MEHAKSNFIREWRRFRGNISQEQLCERLSFSKPTLSRIENGTQSPTVVQLDELAKALNCHIVDLIIRNPCDPPGIWDVWDKIPPEDREKAVKVLEAFRKAS